jgi:hypothetical protein
MQASEAVFYIAVALLGASVGGILTYFTAIRGFYNTSVVAERKAWRDTVRDLSQRLSNALDSGNNPEIIFLRRELMVRLNPADRKDDEILESKTSDELTLRVSVLLKHDWERVKLESSLWRWIFFEAQRPQEKFTKEHLENFKFARCRVPEACRPAALLFLPLVALFVLFLFLRIASDITPRSVANDTIEESELPIRIRGDIQILISPLYEPSDLVLPK